MIQDIGRHIYFNEYKPIEPKEDGLVLMYQKRKVLAKPDEEGNERILYPTFGQLYEALKKDGQQNPQQIYEEAIYLFTIDDCHYYLLSDSYAHVLDEYSFMDISYMRKAQPAYRAFAGVTGLQLASWYESRTYCGRCGSKMVHSKTERMMECPHCHQMEYPKICPAVIVGVLNKGKILVSKYAGREFKNYALIAGFAEIGESIEDTVRREVMEEVGLKVKNLRFYKSQPWSFSDTLLMGFWCEVDGDDAIKLDENELAMAAFVGPEEIPAELDVSLTREMMHQFKYGKVSL
jgi:NAD+ diphosphatase